MVFQPGNKSGKVWKVGKVGGPGRPKRRALFSILVDRAEKEGWDVEEVVFEIYKHLLKAARAGDVTASRLLLERLTEVESLHVSMTSIELSATERVARIRAVLAEARSEVGQDLLLS